MSRKLQAGRQLLWSSLLVLILLSGMFWLLQPPAQAAETAVSPNAPLAPTSVTLVGQLQSELGCSDDWQPECAATHLSDAGYGVWRGLFNVPAGSYEYKVALNDSWDLSYPGSNRLLNLGAVSDVIFYYDDKTKTVLDSVNDVVATAAGDFQDELGCANHWSPDCVATLLTDPNGDGVYTFVSRNIPVGSYEFKVALDESSDVSYPGSNLPFTVATAGQRVTIAYDSSDNSVSVDVGGPLSVTLVGSLQSELGCTDMGTGAGGDWEPACSLTHLTEVGNDVWRGAFELPDGSYEYKMALDDSCDVSYPAGNIALTVAPTSTVVFYYDHKTNAVLDNVNDVVATAVGDFQIALGCDANWSPACVRSLLTDPDGDGIYTFASNGLPAGNYNLKVALNEAWDDAYPTDNVPFTVPSGGELVTVSFDTADNAVSVRVGVAPPIDLDLVRPAVSHPVQDEVFYFALTDRYQDGDPTNNTGGIPGGPTDHGYDPADISYYHGGDLAGLAAADTLDYIEGLGVSAIWITPVFENNPTQPDSTATNGIGAAYHGYWILDYETADPHLGTDQELVDFITAAQARGLKVYFDFVANHTGDIISYAEGTSEYRYKADYPYLDANGDPFDDRDYIFGVFPPLDADISFPYTPQIAPEDADRKSPAWLNDPIYYHNRGDSTFAGESSTYGDFFGLDDVFTEQPFVVAGFTDILTNTIATYGIDGFRMDTVKHVNIEFWQQVIPAIMEYAADNGKPDFFIFGEVFDGSATVLSQFTTEGGLPSVLDFGLHGAATDFAVHNSATDNLRNLYANDDYYLDADSNAYQLGTFVSNHDGFIERLGFRLRQNQGGAPDSEMVDRMALGHALLFFGRGFPVIYYGDEQGFVGGGSDKLAREDMFANPVSPYTGDLIGTDAAYTDDNFDPTHPLYQAYADFAAIREAHLALRRGAQIHRYSQDSAGIYAFSRIERDEQVEYVVALNNASTAQPATFPVFTADMGFTAVYPPAADPITATAGAELTVNVPALGLVIYQANAPLPTRSPADAPDATFYAPAPDSEVSGRVEVGVNLSAPVFAEVNFSVKVGNGDYEYIGTDNNAPYRIFYDVSSLPVGTAVTFQAIVNDLKGNYSNNVVTAVVGAEAPPPPPDSDIPYAIIHYLRDDGDYGDHTTGDYNDFWGLHFWGDGIDPSETVDWTDPRPFLGEAEYGRFTWLRLTDPTEPIGFIVHRGDEKDGTDDDRFFTPASDGPEIWLRQDDPTAYSSQAEAQGFVTVHYQRPGNDYDDWGLHLWQEGLWGTDWSNPHLPDGFDDFGAVFTISVSLYPDLDFNQPLNFIIHKGDDKDPEDSPDRSFLPVDDASIWLLSGDEAVYAQRGEAENFVLLHYRRPLGDYGDYDSDDYNDFWGLHTWGAAADPGWTTPRKPVSEDLFGVTFQVELLDSTVPMGYIFHRGDEKDPGPDQFLNFGVWGFEVWQMQGADPDMPYILPTLASAGPNVGDLSKQSAYWVSEDSIAWESADNSQHSYTLHYAPNGGLQATETGITGGMSLTLTLDPAGLPLAAQAKFPHLAGLPALKIDSADLALVPEILKGQIAISAVDSEGKSVDATGLQIPGVLDDLYAEAAYDEPLGPFWIGGTPALKLWAPTAKSVTLHIFDDADPATTSLTYTMSLNPDSGVWSMVGPPNWKDKYYLYEVEVYVHSTGQVERNIVTDPYSFSLAMNSARSQLVDLTDPALEPAGWDTLQKPPLVNPEDISVYEIHIRDFSVSDPLVLPAHRGTFKAFTYQNSYGMNHLQALAEAGLTHLHLLPVFDIATINEDKSTWQEPDFSGADMGPASEDQQAAVTAVADLDGFNWGYDPFHYTVPEGSYSTVPTGTMRIVEFREMVQNLNQNDLRVVMDVVYNHTNAAGQSEKSVLDRVVPGYYHRLNASGQVETSTCCQNTATEHDMMRKLMVDSIVTWAKEYKVDAFRFDLMGHHMKEDMLAVRAALDALTLEDDGVDGKSIYVYGEGWNFGEVANNARGVNATQLNMAGTGIGTFSDRLRDAVRGPGPFDGGLDLQKQGFANGLYYDPNDHPQGDVLGRLLLLSDQIRVGLAGNLADYQFTDRNGNLVTGAQVDYNGQPTGYTQDPQEHIVYISKHDNQTLYDINAYASPISTTMSDRIRIQQMGLSIVSLSQGVPFYHAGSEMLRSKSLDRDSYNSGDWFNTLDYTYSSNNWGVGLPVAGVNSANWFVMTPRLSNPALLPTYADIYQSAQWSQDWLQIRQSSPLFRLETAVDVQNRLTFENVGPDQIPGLIVMNLADIGPGVADIDTRHHWIVVLFNANDEPQTISSTNWIDQELVLHPVQAASVDAVVQQTTFDSATGTFTVPGRTTAVYVVQQSYHYYLPLAAQSAMLEATAVDPTEPTTPWVTLLMLPGLLAVMLPARRRGR